MNSTAPQKIWDAKTAEQQKAKAFKQLKELHETLHKACFWDDVNEFDLVQASITATLDLLVKIRHWEKKQ